MKRVLENFVFLIMTCALFNLIMPLDVYAANDDIIRIMINNEEVHFSESDGIPFIDSNGRVQVPLRKTMETIGINVSYDSPERSITLSADGITAQLIIDSPMITINQSVFRHDTIPVIFQNRTYLPLRFVLEQFGYLVEWDGDSRIVSIVRNDADGLWEFDGLGWWGPVPSFGPHGYQQVLGFEPPFLMSEEISQDEFMQHLYYNSVGLKSLAGEKSITISPPVRIVYEIYRVDSDSGEELMTRFVFYSYTGELPPYTITWYRIPYSGWTVAKGQYRLAITADSPFVYHLNGETISNTLEEITRYSIVEIVVNVI